MNERQHPSLRPNQTTRKKHKAKAVSHASRVSSVPPVLQDLLVQALSEGGIDIVASKDRILRLPAVLERTGLKRASLYAKIAAGTFPRQVRLSRNMVGWRESDVSAWIASLN